MADAESPASLFELLYNFIPAEQAIRIVYDNGCNFLQYALNRDPVWAGQVRVFVDELHWKGHVNCASSFNTGALLLYTFMHYLHTAWNLCPEGAIGTYCCPIIS